MVSLTGTVASNKVSEAF